MTYIFQPARFELDRAIKKHAGLLRGRLLDIGAGSYDRYSGYFNASEYVRMNLETGPNTQLVGSIEKIPAPDHSFDGIVCTQVLGDVFNLTKAFAEMYRVLKPGGKLLLTESLVAALHDEPHDYWRFTKHSLRRLCEEVGFRVLAVEELGGYWSVREQMSVRYWIEKYNLYHVWWGRFASFILNLLGRRALRRDQHQNTIEKLGYVSEFLMIAEKK